jgi:K+-transporting ATPase c subunit
MTISRGNMARRGDLRALVAKHTLGKQFGLLGGPRVNVAELKLDLDVLNPKR